MTNFNQSYLVQRTCSRKSGNAEEQGSHPLESYRNLPAYVLLGDPGAGKTTAFLQEAKESGGEYIMARDFATFNPNKKYKDKILFIDALDEMRADENDGKTPLDLIRKHLEMIGNPRFRLSCREADWFGESDKTALKRVSPNGEITALQLEPLTDNDIIEILRHKTSISNPAEFIRKASEYRLEELFRNPQTLNLLVEAVGENEWPKSRKEIYEMACHQLVCEKNREHRDTKRNKELPLDKLLNASGYLCTICLLSGKAGFALDESVTDDQHSYWKELARNDMPLLEALKTNLFQSNGEEQRIPVHRSVAEYLSARYLSALIENDGLPFGRILALMTGEDDGVMPDLRGLVAWLSVYCRTGRPVLIERDPLGVVLYGDTRSFSVENKQLVLAALKKAAQYYPWFRSDDWSSLPFGALSTPDMIPAFLGIISSPSREKSDQALLGCVLDAIRHGDPMPTLANSLETIIRDTNYWPVIRKNAVEALKHVIHNNDSSLLKLAKDIREGIIEDKDDEILGILLRKLYPSYISSSQIFDYLHPPKEDHLIGNYFTFWHHKFPELTTNENLPQLLDQFVQRRKDLNSILREHQLKSMVGELLTRGLVVCGDTITDERLYNWLAVGLDKYQHIIRLDKQHTECISNWLSIRPNRYKAILEYGSSLCADQENIRYCMNQCTTRLYYSLPPADIFNWYLEKANMAPQDKLAEYYFQRAVDLLKREGKTEYLTLPKLELIESWVSAHPNFQQWLEPFVTCSIEDWRREQYLREQKYDAEQWKKKEERISNYRQHLIPIREGSAYPQIFHELAQAYDGQFYEAKSDSPHECLSIFFDGDNELIEATYLGFRHILDREDLPNVNEIIDLELKGRMHYIRLPCLIAMKELYATAPSSLPQLDTALLSRLLAFHFTYGVDENPGWVDALIQKCPELVAKILIAYAIPMLLAKKEHVSGLYPLAFNDSYSSVAYIALPELLENFPLRASKPQLRSVLNYLLKGSIYCLDKEKLASIITHKLELGSMDTAQRVYWLASGLIVEPSIYTEKLLQHIGKSKVRKRFLSYFLHDKWERGFPYTNLSEKTIALLIALLAPDSSSERSEDEGWVTPAMHTADLMRSFINTLGSNPNEAAAHELERLMTLPNLLNWHNFLWHSLYTQRIARRKATFRRLDVEQIKRTLANLEPANPADLSALTFNHLCDIARKIRDGSTNDYKQYWSYDASNKKLSKPKPENDCRDALLSDLNERLSKLDIDAQREGNYADDKRADIRVSYGGIKGFNIPIEIKKDNHDDLWHAIHTQLIPKYTRDPGTGGYGIYLVFWFGGKEMKQPIDGSKPSTASELENILRQSLTLEASHKIQVCVIDCALPLS